MQSPSKKRFRTILRFSPMVLGVMALLYSLTLHRSFSDGKPNSVESNAITTQQEEASNELASTEESSRGDLPQEEADPLVGSDELAEANALIEADPLKSALRQALRNFQNLKTYEYEMKVVVYEGGEIVSEAELNGAVKDQTIVAAQANLDGESFEVLSRGREALIKDENGEWIPATSDSFDGAPPAQSAFSFREGLQDIALAQMPLYAGQTEVIDGVPCQSIQMKMSGALPDESGDASSAATEVTFVIDPDNNIRTWRMNAEVLQAGEMMNTIVESTFSKFNDPWEIPLPGEWN